MWVFIFVALLVLLLSFFKKPKMVIVTAHYNEDLEWLKTSKYPVIVCDKLGSNKSSFTPDKKCSLDINRGREASSYLKYIIENYDTLPDKIIFLHGHETAVHQKYPKHLLQAIDDARDDIEFVSLNNFINLKKSHGDPPKLPIHQDAQEFGDWKPAFDDMRENWENLFKPIVGFDMPEYFRFDISAQFIVTRKAIHRHTKETYKKLFDYVVDTNGNDHTRGAVLEFLWQSIFTDTKNDLCNEPNDPMYKECTNENFRKTRFKI